MAMRAGYDGVEVHGGDGYVIDQFLRDGSNLRTDGYGGSAHNRMRLLNEALDAVTGIWSAGRVGVRLTPGKQLQLDVGFHPANPFRLLP